MIKMMIAGLAALASIGITAPAEAGHGRSSWSVSVGSGSPYYRDYDYGYHDPYVRYVPVRRYYYDDYAPVYRYQYRPRYRGYTHYDRPRYRYSHRGYQQRYRHHDRRRYSDHRPRYRHY